ncbi:polysaccharide lyase [Haliea sp. E17]|uniref:polysaccharide lyase n=1 Tax=Haliea sp. E17 TaxID=3401576 RepID=UPI003AAD47DC
MLSLFTFHGSDVRAQLYVRNWESGSLNDTCSGNCPRVTSEIARHGQYSLKSSINRLISPNSFRTELTKPGFPGNFQYRTNYWIGFSTYLPEDWEVPHRFELIAQIHAAPDPGERQRSPVLGIYTGSGRWKIQSRWEKGRADWILDQRIIDDVGRWVDWVIRYRPSWQDDGIMEVWKDGIKVASYLGPNTYEDNVGPYLKIGLYLNWRDRSCCQGTSPLKYIYHDELRIGIGPEFTYQDVAPDRVGR